MSHLTDEQLEDILQGGAEAPDHLDQCPECRARLAEKQALARRVRRAFSSLRAGTALTRRIRTRIAAGPPLASARPRLAPPRAHRRIWPALAVAAVILIAVIPRSLRLDTGAQAQAAQRALVGIHLANLGSLEELENEADPHKRCQCLTTGVAMPCCKRGICLCGCNMREFQGRLVPSCVIERPNTPPVSIVVVPDLPKAMGMTPRKELTATGQAVWQATCESCNIASVRMGKDSCCVIGRVPQESLVSILNTLDQ